MNREQRRQPQQQKRRIDIKPVDYQTGHNDTHVIVVFTKPTEAIAFDPAGLDNFIKALELQKQGVLEGKKNGR